MLLQHLAVLFNHSHFYTDADLSDASYQSFKAQVGTGVITVPNVLVPITTNNTLAGGATKVNEQLADGSGHLIISSSSVDNSIEITISPFSVVAPLPP
jgi:hypothetical protein